MPSCTFTITVSYNRQTSSVIRLALRGNSTFNDLETLCSDYILSRSMVGRSQSEQIPSSNTINDQITLKYRGYQHG